MMRAHPVRNALGTCHVSRRWLVHVCGAGEAQLARCISSPPTTPCADLVTPLGCQRYWTTRAAQLFFDCQRTPSAILYHDVNLDAIYAYAERVVRVVEHANWLATARATAAAAHRLLPRRDRRPERVARLLQRARSATAPAGTRRLAARGGAAGDGARAQQARTLQHASTSGMGQRAHST